MRKLGMCLIAVMFVLGGAAASWGSVYAPTYPENLIVAVDGNGNGAVDHVGPWINNYYDQSDNYSFGIIVENGDFLAFPAIAPAMIFNGVKVEMFQGAFIGGFVIDFAVWDNVDGHAPLSLGNGNGTVVFQGTRYTGSPDAPFWADEWWNNIQISFYDGGEEPVDVAIIQTSQDGMGFAPVPIPATALLFCSGILGIVGIRRKISK